MNSTTEPAWITQAREFYRLLYKHAHLNEYKELVWQGRVVDLYNEVGISNPNHSRVIKLLESIGAIHYIQRGNRWQHSIIHLIWDSPELQPGELIPADHLTPTRHAATMVAEVERRVTSLTAWRESLEKGGLDVAKVLQNFELRITKLERELLNAKNKK